MAVQPLMKVYEDLRYLRDAITNENMDIVSRLAKHYSDFLHSRISVAKKLMSSSTIKVDTLSCSLLPSDIPKGLVAIKSTGNGDSFFNSASLLLFGNETMSSVIRLLTAAEIFLHNTFYANHPRFDEGKTHYSKVTCFMMSLSIDVSNGKNGFECLKQQAIQTCSPREWAGLIHFFALSSVIQRSVFSVYANASPALRPLFHGLIEPREKSTHTDSIYIMFTRDSALNSKPGTQFQPNHFCPLFHYQSIASIINQSNPALFSEDDFPPLTSTADTRKQHWGPAMRGEKRFSSEQTKKRHATSASSFSMSSPKKVKQNTTTSFPQVHVPHAFHGKGLSKSDRPKSPVSIHKETVDNQHMQNQSSPDNLSKVKPFPLLPWKWYEDLGRKAERNVINSKMSTKRKHEMPYDSVPESEIKYTKKDEERFPDFLQKKMSFPLLPRHWYNDVGEKVEELKKGHKKHDPTNMGLGASRTSSSVLSDKSPMISIPPASGQAALPASPKTSRSESNAPYLNPPFRPFPLLKKSWYCRRGKLAVKNIAREKQGIAKQETNEDGNKIGVAVNNCDGTITENKSHLRSLISSSTNKTYQARLSGYIKVAEYLETSGPVISTQEAASVLQNEKCRYMGVACPEQQHRPTSSSIFTQLSRFLNIRQVYIHGKAFLFENRSQNVDEVVKRLSGLVDSQRTLNNKMLSEIGDLYKDSLAYMDTKRDRDVLKALIAKATGVTFAAKLQGVSNKTAIINSRDELEGKIYNYKDIVRTSSVVRNDMTNEQRISLTKRIIEKRKRNKLKLSSQFDSRGRKLKIEEFTDMSKTLERIFETGSHGQGGGLESHPRLITTTRYRSCDNVTFMRHAREILLSCAPLNFNISLSSCYNYTNNYRENSSEAVRHHAGKNINANISLRRPPRDAVVDNKQVVNLHWSTCNVNYLVDIASENTNSYMVDSKDAKRVVLGDCCPVQKPGKTWKKFHLPDHDWDQSRNNAITPMSHLFVESHVTREESIPPLLLTPDVYIGTPSDSSLTVHITRTGRAVTLLNLSVYEPETTNRAFNEIFFLLSQPSLDSLFRNPDTGKLKENFIFIVDNGPAESPTSALVKMWLCRMQKVLNLDSISQVSFAEYHSKRNFVERVHAAENEVLSKNVFSSKSLYENAEPGSKEHKENMEVMAKDVKECLQQAKFNNRFLEVYRGVSDNTVFDDDDELKSFLQLSEERKLECEETYCANVNSITETLSQVWNTDIENFESSYKLDYLEITNNSGNTQTCWNDKYQTTMWRNNENWIGKAHKRCQAQPLPDYVRWYKTNYFHYLTLGRNTRITANVHGRWNETPGLFLPSRLLEILFKINSSPPEDTFKEISLLVWLSEDEVARYFKEANERLTKLFEQEQLKDVWKESLLYKNNSLAKLQEMCKQAGLPTKGMKHQLVKRLCENEHGKTSDQRQLSPRLESVPQSLKEIRGFSTGQLRSFLKNNGMAITGNKDELILRIDLARRGQYHMSFYNEEKEVLETINDAEELILEQKLDYLNHPNDIFRKRTYTQDQINQEGIRECDVREFTLEDLHRNMFGKLKEYLRITKDLNREKGGKMLNNKRLTPGNSRGQLETSIEQFYEVGTKVKVKWSAALIKDTGWRPGWYVAYVQSSDVFQDQIVIEHPSEPRCLYTLDVSPMVADGSLKLG